MEIHDIRLKVSSSCVTASLKDIFKTFLKLGFTAFGGLLMIAYIKKTIVDNRKWLKENEFLQGVALCQTIPGATVVQISSYVGLKLKGYKGAIVSVAGFLIPSFLFISFFSCFYTITENSPIAKEIFTNLQTVVVALMMQAFFVISKINIKNIKSIFIALISTVLFWININPFIVIVLSAIIGMIIFTHIKTSSKKSSVITEKYFIIENLNGVIYLSLVLLTTMIFSYVFNKNLFTLAKTLIGVSILSFGSGYSGTSLMFKEIVQHYHLISSHTFLNGMIFGRITPGPGMMSVFIGFIVFGLIGGIVSLLSIYIPSLIALLLAEPIFNRFKYLQIFQKAILGILASFLGLIVNVIFDFGKLIEWDTTQVIIFILSFSALLLKTNPTWVISAIALLSLIYELFSI